MLVQDTDIRFTLRLLKCCPGFLILLGFILSPAAWSATDCTQVTQIPQLECEALLDLYNNTDGPNWLNKNGWNKTNTPCDGWYGVSCVSGHVVTLSLSNNKLNGTIPELLGNLSQLGILDLDSDQLSGHIPESLGNLSQLGFLSLGNNQQLSGPIPESLGNLSQLESLRLYDSQLSGPIPESLGNLSQLNSLILFNNQLSGPIPESLGNLNQLGQLYLSGNQLCGEIPNTLISLGNMFECDLTSNYLTVNPNSSILISFLNQKCPDWMTQNPPPTKCPPDKPYTLTLQTTGEGTVTAPVGLDDGIQCPDNCSEDYLENSNLTLTAQAADNFIFTQWIGDCTGTDPLLTVTITNNFTCTATFEPKPSQVELHQFSITPAGDGQGTINLQINHAPAVNCQPDCTQTLPHQSEIMLTAQAADEHSVFVGWFGNGCTSHFFLTQDITCTARFDPRPQYTLTVVPQGLGHGYVSSDGGQIACGDQCSHTYLSGTAVTLTATPDSGSSFLGWSGDCQSSTQLATVEVNRQLTCMPSFGTVVTLGPVGTPQLRVDPATGITFSPTQTRAKRTVTLSNPGNGSLILETLTIADITAFQISKDTCSNQRLIPNGTCTVTLVFAPPTTASYQTQLLIPSNAPNTLTAVDLQGSGCSDPADFHSNVVFQPSRLDFGTEPVGHSTTRQQRIDLWSEGCGSVDIDTIKLSGRHADEFAIEKQDCYYGTWQNDNYTSCTLIAAFNPTSAGIKEVQPVITYTDPTLQTSPYRWNAQAVSEGAAQLQLSEAQHDFGTLTLGHEPPPPWLLTLTNTGNVNLEFDRIDITSDFKRYDYGCSILPPQQSCRLTTSFIPTALGEKAGQLTLIYENTTTTIPLSANVTGPADCSPDQVTIETTGNAALWNQAATWQRLNPGAEQPTASDVVRINSGHVVVGSPLIQVKALCIETGAVLVSQDDQGTALAIQATDYFQNLGHVFGLPGQNSTSETCTEPNSIGTPGCAMPGASVIIKVGSQFGQYDKRDDWWWEGDGGPILNTGEIKGGRGGDGQYYAAAGGDTLALGRNTTNQGLIQAGDGGDLTGNNAGQAGRGGVTQIWGKLGGPGYLYNQNGAQALAGNGGHCQPNVASQVGGHGGNLWLVSLPDVYLSNGIYRAGQGGEHCQNAAGDGEVIIEPSIIDISGAKTRVSGGNITIFGGANWILDLRNTAELILDATGDITLATGEGGIIDLRGNQTTLIKAQGQVNLFSDTILVDDGFTFKDLIAAKQVVVGPSQLLRDVSLTAPRHVLGQPQTNLALNFTLTNNGPQAETYTLALHDPAQWTSPLPSSTLTVAELTSVTVSVPVTLPVTSDVTNTVTLTATSQADFTVTASAQVAITVTTQPPIIDLATLNTFLVSQQLPTVSSLLVAESAVVVDEPLAAANDPVIPATAAEIEPILAENPEPSSTANNTSEIIEESEAMANPLTDAMAITDDFPVNLNPLSQLAPTVVTVAEPNNSPPCPLNTNLIDWPCHNEGQILRNVTLGSHASISGGSVAGTIDNQGWLSQIEVANGANVKGGYFTGKIRNHGTLTDIQFVGQELSGGTLAGVIENNSSIGGTLTNISLAEGSTLIGGAVSGHISGYCENPAQLEQVLIKSPSDLNCLILGEGIQLSEKVLFQAVQIVASPPVMPSSQAEFLLPALETVAFDDQAQPRTTSALVAGGISVNEQAFQAVATVTSADWVTVFGQIWTDRAHWNQPAEIIVYGRYQADHSTPVGFMLVKDKVGDKPKIQPWNGELAQLVAFETVTSLADKDWILIYEDFLKLAAGRLELFFGYRVANVVGERRLIQNRHWIEIVIRE